MAGKPATKNGPWAVVVALLSLGIVVVLVNVVMPALDFTVIQGIMSQKTVEAERVARHVMGWNHLYPIDGEAMLHALATRELRMSRHDIIVNPAAAMCELLIVLPTLHRVRLNSSVAIQHLDEILYSLRKQERDPLGNYKGFASVCVLVFNGSPGAYMDFDRVRNIYADSKQLYLESVAPPQCVTCRYKLPGMCPQWCSRGGWCGSTQAHKDGGTDCRMHDIYAQLDKDIQFKFIEQLSFVDSAVDERVPHPSDEEEDRRQALAHALEHASHWRSQYIMVMQDTLVPCDSSALSKLHQIVRTTDRACADLRRAAADDESTWSMIMPAEGANGVVISWKDAQALADYLMSSNTAKSTVDSDLREWGHLKDAAGKVPFTYQPRLFKQLLSREMCPQTSPTVNISKASLVKAE
eukprot:m.44826 g.44826  ORF g.44826 m.44826 type:complete len:410 (-) comp19784_c0_seq1:283-1512(-)